MIMELVDRIICVDRMEQSLVDRMAFIDRMLSISHSCEIGTRNV